MNDPELTVPPVLDSAVPDGTPTGTTAALTPTEADPAPLDFPYTPVATDLNQIASQELGDSSGSTNDTPHGPDSAMDAGAADAQLTADRAAGDAQPLDPNALDQIEQQRTEDAPPTPSDGPTATKDYTSAIGETIEIQGEDRTLTVTGVSPDGDLLAAWNTPPNDPPAEDAPQAEPDTRLLDTSDQDNTTEPEPAYPLPALGDQVLYRNPDTADEKLHPAWVTVIDDERQVVSLFVLFETFSNFVGGVSSGDDPGAWRPA